MYLVVLGYTGDMVRGILRKQFRLLILTLLLFLSVFVWWRVVAASPRELTVAFLTIGQGDSIYIEAPNGNQLLVDGGNGKQILSELGAVMPFTDRSIDIVIGTHPDADHVGGLIPVLSRYTVSAVLEPGSSADTATYRALEKEISDKQIPRIIAHRGMVVDLGGGVTFTILSPDRDTTHMETNESSVVGQLRYGSTTVLLTGDAPQSVERHLVSIDGARLESTVLKAGHHGSRTSSADSFVRTVHPTVAVISAGKNNRYGHPHVEVLQTLKKYGISIVRTDDDGRIVFISDGKEMIRKE